MGSLSTTIVAFCNTKVVLSSIIVGMLLVASQSAHATLINLTTSFSFSGVTSFPGSVAPPVDPVTGSFSVTFDDEADVTGKAVDSIAFTAGGFPESNVFFDYDALDTSGGTPNFHIDIYFNEFQVFSGQNDFLIQLTGLPNELDDAIGGAAIVPDVIRTGFIVYSKPGVPTPTFFTSNGGQNRFDSEISVPAPSVLSISTAGLLALGLAGRRRRRAAPRLG